MKYKKILIILLFAALISINPAKASDSSTLAQVILTQEPLRQGPLKFSKGDEIKTEGTIKTSASHGAKIELLPSHTVLQIAPSSSIELKRTQENSAPEVRLAAGMVRAQVKPAAKKTMNFRIKTLNATMGVRGTDFLAIVNPVLEESEIVVFSGTVDFASTQDLKDQKTVTKNHWGGIGGRFGSTTHDLMELSAKTLKYFDDLATVK